ncbi:MAG: hypothetical protein CMJ64_17485 [Planctomycetaceae bacterium]|nr:hypothetical protein [Planctomycetaceae bacterium]
MEQVEVIDMITPNSTSCIGFWVLWALCRFSYHRLRGFWNAILARDATSPSQEMPVSRDNSVCQAASR